MLKALTVASVVSTMQNKHSEEKVRNKIRCSYDGAADNETERDNGVTGSCVTSALQGVSRAYTLYMWVEAVSVVKVLTQD